MRRLPKLFRPPPGSPTFYRGSSLMGAVCAGYMIGLTIEGLGRSPWWWSLSTLAFAIANVAMIHASRFRLHLPTTLELRFGQPHLSDPPN